MLGTRLQNRYTLRKVLSQRRDRQTYLAWDAQRCGAVAIKILDRKSVVH